MGVKRLIVIGGIILGGGLAMCGIVPSLWLLIVGNAILGLGEGLMLVSLNTFISNYGEEEQRNRGFSGYNAAYLSGMNCGTVIGSLFAEWLGFRPVFYIAGAILAASVIMIIFCMRRQKTPMESGGEKEQVGMSTIRFLLSPRVLIFFAFMLMPYLICASFLSYFFPIFGEENGLSTSFVAQAFLLAGVISIYLGPALTRVIPKYLGTWWSLVLSTAMYVAGFTMFAIQPTVGTGFLIIALLAVADSFGLSVRRFISALCLKSSAMARARRWASTARWKISRRRLGPIIFAALLMLGTERGILLLAQSVGVMLLIFVVSGVLSRRKNGARKRVKEHV